MNLSELRGDTGDIRKHPTVLPLLIAATVVFLGMMWLLASLPARERKPPIVLQDECVKVLAAHGTPVGYRCVVGMALACEILRGCKE